ncbi:MAG: glutamine--fructose-6-phosphate aminotransferase, partial [Actinomycetales bacterium]
MCGIIGYTGPNPALSRILEGLKRLEYRGYDSAGIALVDQPNQPLLIAKKAGKLNNLEAAVKSESKARTGIGHTRWATHGGPTDLNAHPHIDETGKIAVIHNGIIENYLELKEELQRRGHTFKSETDTESVAFLLAEELKSTKKLADAMRLVCKRLRGSFT